MPSRTTTTPEEARNRANDVLLDGVPLGQSYKTSYTPSMDAVEEVTISKASADAENGHSLGGIISLNMKSGTNSIKGSAYAFRRDPKMNSPERPHSRPSAGRGHLQAARHEAHDARRHARRPDQEEQDLQLHVVRALGRQAAPDDRPDGPDGPGTRGRFQPVGHQRQGPHASTTRSPRRSTPAARSSAAPFANNVIPSTMFDPVAVKMLERHSAAEPARQRRQPAVRRVREDRNTGTSPSAST